MTTKRKSTQQEYILSDVIHCSCCGASMIGKKTRYVCPNNDCTRGAGCSTVSVDAERLAHQLIATLVNRVMTPSNLDEIVERIQQGASETLRTQQEKLDNTESAIEELNSRKLNLLTNVEYGETPYIEVVGQIENIEATRAGLAYESAISREEIDKIEFVSNEQAIQSVAQDIGNVYRVRGSSARQATGRNVHRRHPSRRHLVHGYVHPPHTGGKQRRTDHFRILPAALTTRITKP